MKQTRDKLISVCTRFVTAIAALQKEGKKKVRLYESCPGWDAIHLSHIRDALPQVFIALKRWGF
jgi:hypothetical protein